MPKPESRVLADGSTRWFVRLRDPREGPKQGVFTSRTFATRPEAARFCLDIDQRGASWALDEYDRDEADAAELTLDQWAAQHFEAITSANRSTVNRYKRLYRNHWAPTLGPMRLSQIGRRDVARALNAVPGKDKTVLNAWGVLTHMLKTAAVDGLIEKSPTIGVRPSRKSDHTTEEHRYLTQEEFWAVLDATPTHWRPLLLFLGGTGARWGEAAALEVGDIDLKAATVRIVKAEKQDPDNPSRRIVGPTKSRKSRRTVTLPPELVDALRPLIEGRRRNERLFTTPKGLPLRHKTFYMDVWQAKCLRSHIRVDRQLSGPPVLADPQPRLHDLRHSHVAWLIAQGAPLPVIQARLGHEKITTTIDTYGHLLPDLQRAAAEAASVVLRRPTAPQEVEGPQPLPE
jgi:integrase